MGDAEGGILWIELCPPPPKSWVEDLTPKLTVFGIRAFKEVVKIK